MFGWTKSKIWGRLTRSDGEKIIRRGEEKRWRAGKETKIAGERLLTFIPPPIRHGHWVTTTECISNLSPCSRTYGTSRYFASISLVVVPSPYRLSDAGGHRQRPLLILCPALRPEMPEQPERGLRCPAIIRWLTEAPIQSTFQHLPPNRQDPSKLCVLPILMALTMGCEVVSASFDTDILVVWRSESLDASRTHRMGHCGITPDR